MTFRWMMRRLHRWGVSRHKLRGGFLHSKLGDRVLERELWFPDRESLARAFLVGMAVTIVPFLPGQTVVACAIGFIVRANLPVCFLLQYLSNPATAVVHLPACYFTGRYIIGLFSTQPLPTLNETLHTLEAHPFSVALWGEGALALYLGGFVLGPLFGLLGYSLTHLLWKEKPKRLRKGHGLHHHHLLLHPHDPYAKPQPEGHGSDKAPAEAGEERNPPGAMPPAA